MGVLSGPQPLDVPATIGVPVAVPRVRDVAGPRALDGVSVIVLAHRGGTGPWHENTLEAFSGALAFGADGVELDVRRSADGALVVHHDAEVAGAGPIHERRHDELPGWVPPLEEALAACDGSVVNVEIKNAPTEARLRPRRAGRRRDVAALLACGRGRATVARPCHRVVVLARRAWPRSAGRSRSRWRLLVHPVARRPRRRSTRPSRSAAWRCTRIILRCDAAARRAGARSGPGRDHLDGQQPARTSTPSSTPGSTS